MFGDEYPEMADQLRANVSRFSAYKANYVRQAFDDNARQFSGKDLDDANRATINQFRRWTDAELTTAGARARTAKQFTEFNEPDRRELFPCLKWLPSRAANPRQSHMRFYNLVWRKDDTFWDNNAPGTEWNCMCDIEECDDQPTDNSKVKQPDIPKGLEGNPSVTGEIFTDKASYVTKCQNPSVPEDMLKPIMERHDEFVPYLKDKNYIDQKFDWESLGYQAIHKGHKIHDNDKQTYFGEEKLTGDDLENEFMQKAFSKGHSVIFRAERENIVDLDMYLDGIKMDLVSVTKDSNSFRNQLNRKNQQLKDYNTLERENNSSVCMYFHDPSFYSEEKVRTGIDELKRLTDKINIKTIYVLLNSNQDLIKIEL